MTKKIGILTLPLVDNYGGMLQNIALHGYLKNLGYDVVSINHRRVRYADSILKRLAGSVLQYIPFQNYKKFRYEYIQVRKHKKFLDKYLDKRTQLICTRNDLNKVVNDEKFDAIVVGSDQVWRWEYISHDWSRYFLDFVNSKETKKIAYAASFGKDSWQKKELEGDVSRFLSDFHAVSTREESGVKICQKFGRSDCEHVLDPTLLVGQKFYDLFPGPLKNNKKSNILLTYILDSAASKNSIVQQALNVLGPNYELNNLGLRSKVSVDGWVRAFRESEYVITDSFHGMVFSILFNKKFIVLGNEKRGLSRFQSLLNQLGLIERLVAEDSYSANNYISILKNNIDFERVNFDLERLRLKSSNFLLAAIEK